MRVAVIGGTGNISSSVVDELLRRGHEVSVLSRGTGAHDLPAEVRHVHCDRQNRPRFEQVAAASETDAVIDMISFTADDAASAVRAYAGRVSQFVHCSTAVVYGTEFRALPVGEDHPRLATDPYGSNKAAAEDVLWAAHERRGFPLTVLRPSQTYGRLPLLRQVTGWDGRFLDRLRRGLPVTTVDTADKTLWSAMHADDAAVAFAGVLDNPQCIGQAYNVVGDELYSWLNYHRKVAHAVGVEAELVPVPVKVLTAVDDPLAAALRSGTAVDGWFDNSAIRRAVPEFHPVIGLEDGIRRNIEFLDRLGPPPDSRGMTWEDELAATIERRW